MTLTGVISYPVPPYANVPIEPQFYQPSRFDVSAITRGLTTQITTSEDHNYVIGQLIRLIIPPIFGSYQLNEQPSYVISLPSSTDLVTDMDSRQANAFIPTPYTADITNIVVNTPSSITVTANNYFNRGALVVFSGVGGMTEINTLVGTIATVSSTSFTVTIATAGFSAYASGGVASLSNVPQTAAQVLAVGDINNGITSSTGPVQTSTNIPGSFINISPN